MKSLLAILISVYLARIVYVYINTYQNQQLISSQKVNVASQINQTTALSFETLCQKYVPIFYFHEDEKHFPIYIEHYVRLKNKICQNQPIKPTPIPVSWSANITYCHIADVDVNTTYLQITYILLYNYNIGKSVVPKQSMFHEFLTFGNHYLDAEHVTVFVNKQTQQIDTIYFSAHGSDESHYIKTAGVEFEVHPKTNRLHPIVYVAKDSHSHYNQMAVYIRQLIIMNDFTSYYTRYTPTPKLITSMLETVLSENTWFNQSHSLSNITTAKQLFPNYIPYRRYFNFISDQYLLLIFKARMMELVFIIMVCTWIVKSIRRNCSNKSAISKSKNEPQTHQTVTFRFDNHHY